MPDTHFGLTQIRKYLCYKSPQQEQSERGKLKTTVLSSNCPADVDEMVAFLYKLLCSQCWDT